VGQPIGSRYELEEQLGRGAFGSVYRGRVRDTGEAVAVKVLLEELAADADVVTRFLRERTALVGLRHRSLVAIRDLVVEGDVLALVMQLVEGPDLRAYQRGRGTLGPEEAALLVADVADALSVAHVANIIHRDVKPANVLLQPEAGGFRPLLTDFGIARLADAPSVTRTSQVVGTPYYLSPEVISGQKATPAVDVYACGIMLYELLTGHPPFRGRDAMEVFRAHQTAMPQRPGGLSDRLWAVALAALAKDPDQRPTAGDLAARLRSAVRTNGDGTTVRLPVNPADGTAMLPKLAGAASVPGYDSGRKIAAGAGSTPPPAAWAAPQAAVVSRPAQASATTTPMSNAYSPAPAPVVQAAPTQSAPMQAPPPAARPPQLSAPPQAPHVPQGYAQPRMANQAPPIAQPPRASSYPGSGSASAPYQQPQAGPYPGASSRQAPPAPQYRPPQQPHPQYAGPRAQAPRHPQTYSGTAPARSGLSCLSKLAILVIVLLIAVAIGVTVGRMIAKHNGNGNGNRSGFGYVNQQGPPPPAAISLLHEGARKSGR
jgi:serine/threonine-protein kinase